MPAVLAWLDMLVDLVPHLLPALATFEAALGKPGANEDGSAVAPGQVRFPVYQAFLRHQARVEEAVCARAGADPDTMRRAARLWRDCAPVQTRLAALQRVHDAVAASPPDAKYYAPRLFPAPAVRIPEATVLRVLEEINRVLLHGTLPALRDYETQLRETVRLAASAKKQQGADLSCFTPTELDGGEDAVRSEVCAVFLETYEQVQLAIFARHGRGPFEVSSALELGEPKVKAKLASLHDGIVRKVLEWQDWQVLIPTGAEAEAAQQAAKEAAETALLERAAAEAAEAQEEGAAEADDDDNDDNDPASSSFIGMTESEFVAAKLERLQARRVVLGAPSLSAHAIAVLVKKLAAGGGGQDKNAGSGDVGVREIDSMSREEWGAIEMMAALALASGTEGV